MDTNAKDLKPEEMPAFPLHAGDVWGGMTLRDYFAAQALAGCLAKPDCQYVGSEKVAHCYELADYMLAARARKSS